VVQFLSALIYFLLLIMSVFLVCLVLIQRGKGGGLAGAFGGVGSSSAFGTKAGDVFTRVTMISAGIWIALNMVLVILSNQRTSAWGDTPTLGSASKSAFSPSTDKSQSPSPAGTNPTAPAAANPFDALAPAVPSAPAPSPLGKGGTPAIKDELPSSPFGAESSVPPSPLPAGSTPSGGAGNPKP